MNSTYDSWLIDSNIVGVISFYKDKDFSYKFISYMFIEEGIIVGIHGENPSLSKNRKKLLSQKQDYYGKNY